MKELLKREAIQDSDKWNLEAIYSDLEQYQKDVERMPELIAGIAQLKGSIRDAGSYLTLMRLQEEAGRMLGKLYIYGMLKYNEDLSNQAMQSLKQQGEALYTEYSTVSAFVEPELLALPDEVFQAILQDEAVASYRFHLEKLRNLKAHVLSPDQEEVLAALGEVRSSAQSAYSIYSNAELKFPNVLDEQGEEHLLTNGSFAQLMKAKDRTLRKNAFQTLHQGYGNTENTLGFLLVTSMKDYVVEARLRRYKSSVEQALKPNAIPVSVFYNAVETIDEQLHLLHRYVSLKKKFLGLQEMHLYDLYVPLGEAGSERYSFDEAVELTLSALKPLGEEYLSIYRQGIQAGWIDRYENQGKRSGAYSSGTYDTMPYVSLNFKGTLNDVSTLAHEMGHSMHSYYTRTYQPYLYGNYSIFLAEVASTCNEKLLIHDLIAKETNRAKRIALINQELEQVRTTVYRQLMFAQFERVTHERLEAGEQLNAGSLDEIWLQLNRRFFGGDMVIDDVIQYEWARIPHFYNDFYVYQYATGYAMASSLARMILKEGEPAAQRYIQSFLKAGSSRYPVDVMKEAGVDITTPKPLEDTLKDFAELMDLLEQEFAQEREE